LGERDEEEGRPGGEGRRRRLEAGYAGGDDSIELEGEESRRGGFVVFIIEGREESQEVNFFSGRKKKKTRDRF